MLSIMYVLFVLTTVAIFFVLKAKSDRKYSAIFNKFVGLEDSFDDLSKREERLREANSRREEDVSKIANIYEVTKDICEFLEVARIFPIFKSGLSEFIKFDECSYLSSDDFKDNLKDFEIIPLISGSENHGYLAIKGLKKEERALLDILIAQLVTSIKRAKLYERIQGLAITDSLTKVFTRRYSVDRFEEELKRSQEFNLNLSFLMIDIDDFKSYNDKYGHLVGDAILKTAADIIKLNCREIDLIGRFGGEEFMVIMPMTDKDGALFAAERMRKSLESRQVEVFDESLRVTISIGVSTFSQDATTIQDLIDKADWALYRSKRTGKNRVSAYAKYKQS